MVTSTIGTYYGRPVEELTREELLEVIRYLSDELTALRDSHRAIRELEDLAKVITE